MNKILLAVALTAAAYSAQGQAAIGTTTPNASSILDLNSTSKGLLPPRLTASERGSISNPATGLVVYQTDVPAGLYVNNGTPTTPNWVNAAPASGVNIALLAQSNAVQTFPAGQPNTLVDVAFGSYAANPAFNGTTYTVPAAGVYEITAHLVNTELTQGYPAILVNGTARVFGTATANGNMTGAVGRSFVTAVLSLAQNDAVKIALQVANTSTALNTTSNGTTRLSIVRLQ